MDLLTNASLGEQYKYNSMLKQHLPPLDFHLGPKPSDWFVHTEGEVF